jgi:hypothetical protein
LVMFFNKFKYESDYKDVDMMMGSSWLDRRARCVICGRRGGRYHHGVIAQLVERVLSMHEALGSTPSNSIFLLSHLTLHPLQRLITA